jgi:CRISPR-associated endonuclease/helicase Cas3
VRREPVAHSPPHDDPGRPPQLYRDHVEAVREGARRRAECSVKHAPSPPTGFLDAVVAAAEFHDLGKLDTANQGPLSRSRSEALPKDRDHMDAGIAHLLNRGNEAAAWLVRAHHHPGLPEAAREQTLPRALRGGRNRNPEEGEHRALIEHVDAHLAEYVAAHERACGTRPVAPMPAEGLHRLPMRLALSCLVDADHTDSASYDSGVKTPMPGEDRARRQWRERLQQLQAVVAEKARNAGAKGAGERVRDRMDFFDTCLRADVHAPLVRCEGPVGIGKTLAITAHLLRQAADADLRHIFVIAPYTNIITQAVRELRTALVLPGEDPEEIVAEHHHRADFSSRNNREIATLWRAPVIVTTAVQFFETLASNEPARLRKLHELPGSAVFLDEAHAALPATLWPQNWQWMRLLAEEWGCRFVFASGSLARFWEMERVVGTPVVLPDLLLSSPQGHELQNRLLKREETRVRYIPLAEGLTVERLCDHIWRANGPRLAILNTVQTAARIAYRLRALQHDVLHLSAALCPRDRDRIIRRIKAKLRLERMVARNDPDHPDELDRLRNWTLVATSMVEAGVDLSFLTAFRERASAASLIQVGGRVNRHRERGEGIVYDFTLLKEEGITNNPQLKSAADVLAQLLDADRLNDRSPSELVTEAIEWELDERVSFVEKLKDAEWNRDYPLVAKEGRVIDDDTVLVVVDEALQEALRRYEKVRSTELLRLSVQLRRSEVAKQSLEPLPTRGTEIYAWSGLYDPEFLGVMQDRFRTEEVFSATGGGVF